VTSVGGAFAFGKLTARLSSKRSLIISLIGMIVACSLIVFADSLTAFYAVGALAGFALTGVQSVSRTSVGEMAPAEKSAEFFGIQSLAQQISAFTGPLIYGNLAATLAVTRVRAGWDPLLAEQAGMRGAVIAMIVFLAAGLVILLFVRNWRSKLKAE
jgi:UMF1 family MFS transporter